MARFAVAVALLSSARSAANVRFSARCSCLVLFSSAASDADGVAWRCEQIAESCCRDAEDAVAFGISPDCCRGCSAVVFRCRAASRCALVRCHCERRACNSANSAADGNVAERSRNFDNAADSLSVGPVAIADGTAASEGALPDAVADAAAPDVATADNAVSTELSASPFGAVAVTTLGAVPVAVAVAVAVDVDVDVMCALVHGGFVHLTKRCPSQHVEDNVSGLRKQSRSLAQQNPPFMRSPE